MTYNHELDHNDKDGMIKLMSYVFSKFGMDKSYVDVGCGLALYYDWAKGSGVNIDLYDGVQTRPEVVPIDLTNLCDLGKHDVAICLEVAEHLPESSANNLIKTLTSCADAVVFSGAVPHQAGQGHINCQPPIYWQKLFNKYGFLCKDKMRWLVWDEKDIPVWYRQNIFIAYRSYLAGAEPRLKFVIHPEFCGISY